MHARSDNPELQAAVRQGIKVYSFPEYLYEQCRSKTRVVIAGSHGKTTITSMVMHALRSNNWKFDYMVGAQLEGFDTMVGLSEDAEIAVFEEMNTCLLRLTKGPSSYGTNLTLPL